MSNIIPASPTKGLTMSKRDAARAALSTVPNLHEGFHGPILAALADKGIVEPENGGAIRASAGGRITRLDQVAAAAQSDPLRRSALRYAMGALRQLGVGVDDILADDDGHVSNREAECFDGR
jgi:hypothetical protein